MKKPLPEYVLKLTIMPNTLYDKNEEVYRTIANMLGESVSNPTEVGVMYLGVYEGGRVEKYTVLRSLYEEVALPIEFRNSVKVDGVVVTSDRHPLDKGAFYVHLLHYYDGKEKDEQVAEIYKQGSKLYMR